MAEEEEEGGVLVTEADLALILAVGSAAAITLPVLEGAGFRVLKLTAAEEEGEEDPVLKLGESARELVLK